MIIATGAGLLITTAGHAISVRRSVYYGADCFLPVRSLMDHSVRCLYSFRSAPIETPRKLSVIQRTAKPAVKRPAVAGPSFPQAAGGEYADTHAQGWRDVKPSDSHALREITVNP